MYNMGKFLFLFVGTKYNFGYANSLQYISIKGNKYFKDMAVYWELCGYKNHG